MEAKLKAEELVDKFARIDGYEDSIDLSKCEYEKQCALIAVDEILNIDNVKPYILHKEIINYYTKVKEEINKL